MRKWIIMATILFSTELQADTTIKPPNILMISIDSLRADHLGCYGYSRDTSPNIDRLAKEGILFSQAISPSSWTLPVHMSVFTSLYPGVHGVINTDKRLSRNAVTLTQVLKGAGYHTSGFVSVPYTLGAVYGFDKGFDVYDDYTIHFDRELDLFKRHGYYSLGAHNDITSDIVTKLATRWLDRLQQPFFLSVHYDNTAINPVKEEIDLKDIISLYGGEIRHVDRYVGRLLENIRKLGLEQDTIIILFGDHGDEFFEHEGIGHGTTLYDELIHVPLIIKYPGYIPAGKIITEQVSLVDIMPTLLDLAGIKFKDSLQIQGQSLMGLIQDNKIPEKSVYSEIDIKNNQYTGYKSIRTSRYKYIWSPESGKEEFYDLIGDPQELINLINIKPTQAGIVKNEMSNWLEESNRLAKRFKPHDNKPKNKKKEDITREQKEKLKSLGYIQ